MRSLRLAILLGLALAGGLARAEDDSATAAEPLDAPADDEPAPDPEMLPEPEDEAAGFEEAPAATAPRGSASQQWVITHKMRAALAGLGYTEVEVSALDPQRARAIIDKSIARPSRGVPASWNKGARGQSRGPLGLCRSVLSPVRKAVGGLPGGLPGALLLAGAVAAGASRGGAGAFSIGAAGPRLRKALESMTPAAEPEAPEAVWVDESEPSSSTEELWLDRQIDNIGRLLKALFGK